jgi:FkbM family methyltransferase
MENSQGGKQMITSKMLQNVSVYAWGGGARLLSSLEFLHSQGINIAGIADSNPKKQGTTLDNIPVISPDRIPDNAFVFITTPEYCIEIAKELRRRNIAYALPNLLALYSEEFQAIKHKFADERSKQVLQGLYNFYSDCDTEAIKLIAEENQYFAVDTFKFVKRNEVVVDGGAFTGDTMEIFLNRPCGSMNIKEYHAFEPDSNNLNALNARIERFNREYGFTNKLIHHNCGLSDKRETLCFSGETSGNMISKDGDKIIEVVGLDSFNIPATFIKADIEGAELAMLKGAATTIRTYKPKLAVCVYHKPQDLAEIPQYILSLVPGYKLAIRHHTDLIFETVLYAWVE